MSASIARAGAPLCVGLDPVVERFPAELHDHRGGGLAPFTECVIRAVAASSAAIKFQSACYERWLEPGIAALREGMALAKSLGLLVILDAKRGDIGISAVHYAHAARSLGADWITVSPYLGMETVEPYLEAGLGAFVLVRTSNPGSDSLQRVACSGEVAGLTIAQVVAEQVSALGDKYMSADGASAVGAVVGATKRTELADLRNRMPAQPLLLPGIGAQGATVDDVQAAFDPRTAGALATSSRAIIYASAVEGEPWHAAVERAAMEVNAQLRGRA